MSINSRDFITNSAGAHYFFLFYCVFIFSCTHAKNKKNQLKEGMTTTSGTITAFENRAQHTNTGIPNEVKSSRTDKKLSLFTQGLDLFYKGQLNSARREFEKLNYQDKYFIEGLTEIQKINYAKGDWERFFGLALYYRNIFLSSDKISISHFREELLTLEILALIRHCRFNESRKIIEWSLKLAKKIKIKTPKIKKTAYFLQLRNFIKEKKKKQRSRSWTKKLYLWPLSFNQLRLLDNPKNLRVRVKSQCQSG